MRTLLIVIFAVIGLFCWPFLLLFHVAMDIIGYILKPYIDWMARCVKEADRIIKESEVKHK